MQDSKVNRMQEASRDIAQPKMRLHEDRISTVGGRREGMPGGGEGSLHRS